MLDQCTYAILPFLTRHRYLEHFLAIFYGRLSAHAADDGVFGGGRVGDRRDWRERGLEFAVPARLGPVEEADEAIQSLLRRYLHKIREMS